MVFSNSSDILDITWVIISVSSIPTPNFVHFLSNNIVLLSSILDHLWYHVTHFLKISCVVLSWTLLSLTDFSCLTYTMHWNQPHYVILQWIIIQWYVNTLYHVDPKSGHFIHYCLVTPVLGGSLRLDTYPNPVKYIKKNPWCPFFFP